MGARAITGSFSQSLGSATLNGSFDQACLDPVCIDVEARIDWGYDAFNQQTGHQSFLGCSGATSGTISAPRTVATNPDVILKYRARAQDFVCDTISNGDNVQFLTFANSASIGTPVVLVVTQSSGSVRCTVVPNTVSSSSTVVAFIRQQGVGSFVQTGLLASLPGGASATAVDHTFTDLQPFTTYEFFYRLDRQTANGTSVTSSTVTFTTGINADPAVGRF